MSEREGMTTASGGSGEEALGAAPPAGEPLPEPRPAGGRDAPDWQRTVWCGELRAEDEGRAVVINGWVQRTRDHGHLLFVDVRDRTGVVQATLDATRTPAAHADAAALRPEFVVSIAGTVRRRAPGAENPRMATGAVEIEPERVTVLSVSKTPPFAIEDRPVADHERSGRGGAGSGGTGGDGQPRGAGLPGETDERVRLRYRYLDLRRPEMFRRMQLRHRFIKAARDWCDARGFLEIETPMLTRSTPEGARDYLVPSRQQPGSFYALPQSPQLFKQLLMVAGVERYVQFVRCFRDEDLRADRQPEFAQIDLEMSFVGIEDVMSTMEDMMVHALGAVGRRPPRPFPRITYREAMDRYGCDKPDLRFGVPVVDVSDLAVASGFGPFRSAVAVGGAVRAILAPGGAALSRREIDGLTEEAKARGASGLAWLAFGPDGLRGPLARVLAEAGGDLEVRLRARFAEAEAEARTGMGRGTLGDAVDGGLALFVAGEPRMASEVLGHLRIILARRLDLIPEDADALIWVTDFPLFEWNEDEGRWDATHHPFTAPVESDLPRLESDPGSVLSQHYDMVWNGYELGSGSIRIHRRDVQEAVFRVMGISPEEARERFGFLLDAFEYGPPPHGGMALGIDRIVMIVAGADSIREVIAFPKTASGADPLTGAPAAADERQLEELGLAVRARDTAPRGRDVVSPADGG